MYNVVIYRPNDIAGFYYVKSYHVQPDGNVKAVRLNGDGIYIKYEPEKGEELEIREILSNGYKVVFGGCWLLMPYKFCTAEEQGAFNYKRNIQLPVFHGKGWQLVYGNDKGNND